MSTTFGAVTLDELERLEKTRHDRDWTLEEQATVFTALPELIKIVRAAIAVSDDLGSGCGLDPRNALRLRAALADAGVQ